jgi:hypothetical protein
MRSVRSVWLVALCAMGCSAADPFGGPASIDGKWGEGGLSVPGNFFEMDLSSTGSTVSGSGNYCGEAGPCGAIAVAGTIDGIAIHLDLTFTEQVPRPGHTMIEHFDGRFTSVTVIEGSIATDIPGQVPGHTSYHRVS